MLYNLRSDIIYYKSSSDFELEFNLCGCCRMRLLTDKPSNKKAFVHSLARAVSRSRIILIAGPLFGDENTIDIVSQALGTATEIVNNEAYNIASDEEIAIIKGSIPLVSGDGAFGGCIIESGPQTMILLTDNKTLRKSIMSNLIHPYISDLYAGEMQLNGKEVAESETAETDDGIIEENETIENSGIIIDDPEDEAVEIFIPEVEEEKEIVLDDENLELFVDHNDEYISEDLKPEDIFIETIDTEEIEYEPNQDITFDDLIPPTLEFEEPARTIDEKINEAAIVLDESEYTHGDLPQEYVTTFESLCTEAGVDEDNPTKHNTLREFQFLDDEGVAIGDRETIFENRKSGLQVATIIVTVILLLAIILLCYAIFSASTSEGMAPTEYIRSVWETVFG